MHPELVRQVYFRAGNPHGIGRCWHCGCSLPWDPGAPRTWHVDHWPVARRDIVDQVLVGVRDPQQRDNLVPACIPCNTSHKYEIRRWYWLGRSQPPVTSRRLLLAAVALLLAALILR
jgi:hypothetical protein